MASSHHAPAWALSPTVVRTMKKRQLFFDHTNHIHDCLPFSLAPSRRSRHQHKAIIADPAGKKSTSSSHETSSGIHKGLITVPEVSTPLPLEVVGELPAYLGTGAYYRNGPGMFEVRHKDGLEYIPEHWFDVLGMVHAFFLDAKNGTVEYKSKMTADAVVRAIESVPGNRYVTVNFSRHFRPADLFGRLMYSLGPMTLDPKLGSIPFNVNVSLQELPTKGILNARTDANIIHRLDPNSLETVERYDFSLFNSELTKTLCSSHGMLDTRTGEYFNFMMDYGVGRVEYKVFRIDQYGKTDILTTFKDYPYYIHSFSLTENFMILMMWPCEINTFKLLRTKSFVDACRLRPNTQTNFVVISRQTGAIVAVYEHEPFFCFHTINAFEQDDEIVIDLSYYDDLKIMKDLRVDNIRKNGYVAIGRPVRFSLGELSSAISGNLDGRPKAVSRTLADIGFEFGTVSPNKQHVPYRYAYGASDNGGRQFFGDVTKLDVQTGNVLPWTSPATLTGEPLFVPDPSGVDEDDGCLLLLCLDTKEEKSSLVVLDARTMTEVARAVVPMPLPLGFHGFFQS